MPLYDFICTKKKCGFTTELLLSSAGGLTCPKGHALRRNWSSINVNTVNLRSARG